MIHPSWYPDGMPYTFPGVVKHASRRATPDERTAVELVTVQAYPRGITGIAGVPVREADDHLWVLLYSAGCVHDEYPIALDSIVKREPDPR